MREPRVGLGSPRSCVDYPPKEGSAVGNLGFLCLATRNSTA